VPAAEAAQAPAQVVPWSAGSQVLHLPAYTSYGTTPFFPVIYSVCEPAAAAHTAAGLSQHATTTSAVGHEPAASTSSRSSSISTGIEHAQHASDSNISSSSSSGSKQRPWSEMWRSAGAHALGGGIPGSAAMLVQVRLAGCTDTLQPIQYTGTSKLMHWFLMVCMVVCIRVVRNAHSSSSSSSSSRMAQQIALLMALFCAWRQTQAVVTGTRLCCRHIAEVWQQGSSSSNDNAQLLIPTPWSAGLLAALVAWLPWCVLCASQPDPHCCCCCCRCCP
jgi:hypothetical protein